MANLCQLLPPHQEKCKLTSIRNFSYLVGTEKVPIVWLDMIESDVLADGLPALVGAVLNKLRHQVSRAYM